MVLDILIVTSLEIWLLYDVVMGYICVVGAVVYNL